MIQMRQRIKGLPVEALYSDSGHKHISSHSTKSILEELFCTFASLKIAVILSDSVHTLGFSVDCFIIGWSSKYCDGICWSRNSSRDIQWHRAQEERVTVRLCAMDAQGFKVPHLSCFYISSDPDSHIIAWD